MTLARRGLLLTTVFLILLLLAALAGTAQAAPTQPSRVLVVVMDQMHPQYAKQYNMKNVLWLENHGAWFKNAYVGDMASETVVSHNVMVSGLYPKNMGWSDEALRDTGDVLGGGADGIYVTGDLGYADFQNLITARDYPKLGTYLHAKFPGSTVACVGEKSYQVESMAADNADIAVRLSGTKTAEPMFSILGGKYRIPAGVNIPSYIADDTRFDINSDATYNDYGTNTASPAWIYPEDGDRMVPGTTEGHLGGDDWVADATIKIMQNTANTPGDWSGLFVNFGAIDKIGHMWGGGEVDNLKNYQWDPNSLFNQVHEPFIAKNADDQLGRLIGTLKALNEFDDTLIVVVADHGSTAATKHFYGVNAQGAGDYNWYLGNALNESPVDYYNLPGRVIAPALQPLIATGNVAFNYSSTAIETWLTDYAMPQKLAAAAVMRTTPGVIATYVKKDDGSAYTLYKKNAMTKAESTWWKAHGQELVDTMAWSGSADVVGLLQNRTTYGAFGDHGGAQMDVQRIPMVFYNPSLKAVQRTSASRLVDLMPTIMKSMGIAASSLTTTVPMDGHGYTLATK